VRPGTGLRHHEIDQRHAPSQWEADLIKGSRNGSAVDTLIERTSPYAKLTTLDGCDAQSVLEGFTKRLLSVPACLRKTPTHGQGTAMDLHETLIRPLKMDIFFCDPHRPWQRAANENANGLIGEYLPKVPTSAPCRPPISRPSSFD
jgi:transposase, IS30 family